MTDRSRRLFLHRSGLFVAGSLAPLAWSRGFARARETGFTGYGDVVEDPDRKLDLPRGFRYRAFSREGDLLTSGEPVPGMHDGMAAFSAGSAGTWLIRNHELSVSDVDAGNPRVPQLRGMSYDADAVGGTTTLLVSPERRLVEHRVSLAGTLDNCSGGPSPWNTWLTCEENLDDLAKPHGYVFEVDPVRGGNPEPIRGMGRFEHEAVSFGADGTAYLTEDSSGPFGCVYRYRPSRPLAGRGSLHAGGVLQAMVIDGVQEDLSSVQSVRTRRKVRWVDIRNPDPDWRDDPVRVQAIARGATPIPKAEGTFRALDGSIWLVSSYGEGAAPHEGEAASARAHGGQIWRYDPRAEQVELVAMLQPDDLWDGPDNLTATPHGFVLACTDGHDGQWVIGIAPDGTTFPFARNAQTGHELSGVTMSPDGQTLFFNAQGGPATTYAVWGPWGSG